MPQNHLRAEKLNDETFSALMDAHTDVTGAVDVDIKVNKKDGVVHVNINGMCLLRVCRAQRISMTELGTNKERL